MDRYTIEITPSIAEALCATLAFDGTDEERRSRLGTYLSSVVAAEVRRVLKAKALAEAEAAFDAQHQI